MVAIAHFHSAEAQTVTIGAADCTQFIQHVPASDVVFVPGVDLQGRPVVPADLGGAIRLDPPKELSIPISVDLQKSLGIPVDPNLFQSQNFTVGVVVWKNGKGYFNGQPLQNGRSMKHAALCQKRMLPIR